MTTAPDVVIRRVRPSDGDLLAEFYSRLGPESRRARFLSYGGVGVPGEAARTFCTPDHVHEEGFVALAARPSPVASPEQQIVGHLCLVPSGANALELGVAVADDQQGRGIGRRLFETALAWARDQGRAEINATAFADNTRVLRLLSSAPHPAHITPADGGVVEVVIPLVGPLPTTRSWPPYSADHAAMAQSPGSAPARAPWSGRFSPHRVALRRRPRPGRGAEGSASRGSSSRSS